MSKILFFGYGAYKSKQKLKEVIGRDPGEGVGAIVEGFTLHVQELVQVPKQAQDDMRRFWGNEFKAYTLRTGDGVVSGIIWEIEEEELVLVKEWEYDGLWREFIEVEVVTSALEKVKVLTEKSMDQFPTTFIVDGLLYDVFAFTRNEGKTDPNKNEYYDKQQIAKIKQWLSTQITHQKKS